MSFHVSPLGPHRVWDIGESGLGRPNPSPSSRYFLESEFFVIPAHRSCCNAHVIGYQLSSVLAGGVKLYEMDVCTEYLRKYAHVLWSVGHVS